MKIFRQTDGCSCGPRSLQIAFSHYDIYPGYRELVSICHLNEYGTPLKHFAEAVEHYGMYSCEHFDDATPELIKTYTDENIPVIVMWYVGEGEHVSVAYKVDETFVYLLDPASQIYTESITMIRRTMLEKCWKVHEYSRWFMAILGPV